jgi:hypothetical protein
MSNLKYINPIMKDEKKMKFALKTPGGVEV